MEYRREIDGLRALAVVPVILFHAGIQLIRGGFIGVDIFFVISGYLITTIILTEKEAGTFSIIKFYERRARRILPALFVVMSASFVLAWFWLLPGDMESFTKSLKSVSTFTSNITFYKESGYFDTESELKPLLHTWSLAVEEQYYLFFPVLIAFVWRYMKKSAVLVLLAVAVCSFIYAQVMVFKNPAAAFYLLPSRIWELMIGALTASYLLKRATGCKSNVFNQVGSMLGLVLILYSIFAFNSDTLFPSYFTLIPIIGSVLIIVFARAGTLAGNLLGSRLFVGVGLISYSLYLWHQPLFAFARQRSLEQPGTGLLLALSVLAVIFAYISWKYVEKPFRNKQAFTRKQIFSGAVIGSAFFIVVGILGHSTKGFPGRLPQDVNKLAQLIQIHKKYISSGGCNISDDGFDLKGCVKGDSSIKPKYLLVGDSHASALAYEFERAFKRNGQSFVQYTKHGCPLAFEIQQYPNRNCDKYQRAYLQDADARGIETYIIVSRWPYYVTEGEFNNGEGGIEGGVKYKHTIKGIGFDESFEKRRKGILETYKQSVQQLLTKGKKVVLIYPIPEQGWDIPKVFAKELWFNPEHVSDFAVSYQTYMTRAADIIEAFDSIGDQKNLVRIRPDAIFCNSYVKNRCASKIDGDLLYFDDDHLTNAGSTFVVNEVMKQLNALQ